MSEEKPPTPSPYSDGSPPRRSKTVSLWDMIKGKAKKKEPMTELQELERLKLSVERERAKFDSRRLQQELREERSRLRSERFQKYNKMFDAVFGPPAKRSQSKNTKHGAYRYASKKKNESQPEDGFDREVF